MSTTFKIEKIEGVNEVLAALVAIGGKMEKEGVQALTDEANNVLKKSMDQCPVETGTLRRSGTVDAPKITAGSVTVEIGYNTDYALYVHENLNARHATGKAKFLEDPVNAAAPLLAAKMAARIRAGGLL